MGPRKVSRTPKKLNKKFNKTRSKKQRGSGIASSRPIAPEVPNDPNTINDYLRLALEEGSSESVGKYLNEGADPNMTIKDLVKNIDVDLDKNEDVPAIIYAARHNKSSGIIEKLLEKGANVEQQPYYISTPLIEAAEYGNSQAVRILLDNKANINAKNGMDTPPIAYAILNEDINMIKLMLRKSEGEIDLNDIKYELSLPLTHGTPEIRTLLRKYVNNQSERSGSGRKRRTRSKNRGVERTEIHHDL